MSGADLTNTSGGGHKITKKIHNQNIYNYTFANVLCKAGAQLGGGGMGQGPTHS